MNTIRQFGHEESAGKEGSPQLATLRTPIELAFETACDIAANGLPVSKNARLVAKVEDLNHGDGRPKPAAVVGISFSF